MISLVRELLTAHLPEIKMQESNPFLADVEKSDSPQKPAVSSSSNPFAGFASTSKPAQSSKGNPFADFAIAGKLNVRPDNPFIDDIGKAAEIAPVQQPSSLREMASSPLQTVKMFAENIVNPDRSFVSDQAVLDNPEDIQRLQRAVTTQERQAVLSRAKPEDVNMGYVQGMAEMAFQGADAARQATSRTGVKILGKAGEAIGAIPGLESVGEASALMQENMLNPVRRESLGEDAGFLDKITSQPYAPQSARSQVSVREGYADPKWWTENLASVSGQLGSQLIGGAVAGPIGFAMAAGVPAFDQAYVEARQEMRRAGVDERTGEIAALGEGLANAVVEVGLDYLIADKIIGNDAARAVKAPAKNWLRNTVVDYLKAGGAEAGTEATTSGVQEFVKFARQKLVGMEADADQPDYMTKVLDNMLTSAALGFGAGVGARGVVRAFDEGQPPATALAPDVVPAPAVAPMVPVNTLPSSPDDAVRDELRMSDFVNKHTSNGVFSYTRPDGSGTATFGGPPELVKKWAEQVYRDEVSRAAKPVAPVATTEESSAVQPEPIATPPVASAVAPAAAEPAPAPDPTREAFVEQVTPTVQRQGGKANIEVATPTGTIRATVNDDPAVVQKTLEGVYNKAIQTSAPAEATAQAPQLASIENTLGRIGERLGNASAFEVVEVESGPVADLVAYGRKIGIEIVPAAVMDDDIADRFNGAHDPQVPNRVVVNVNKPADAMLGVALHEIVHSLAATNPNALAALESIVGRDAEAGELQAEGIYAPEGIKVSPEEGIARVVESLAKDLELRDGTLEMKMRDVEDASPGITRTIINSINSFVKRIAKDMPWSTRMAQGQTATPLNRVMRLRNALVELETARSAFAPEPVAPVAIEPEPTFAESRGVLAPQVEPARALAPDPTIKVGDTVTSGKREGKVVKQGSKLAVRVGDKKYPLTGSWIKTSQQAAKDLQSDEKGLVRAGKISVAAIEKRLIDIVDEMGGLMTIAPGAYSALGGDDVRLTMEDYSQTGDDADERRAIRNFSMKFSGRIPTELREALQGKQHLYTLLSAGSGDKAMANDTLATLGTDRYIEILEGIHSRGRGGRLKAIEESMSDLPDVRFMLDLRNAVKTGYLEIKSPEVIDASKLPYGATFTIGGNEGIITEGQGDGLTIEIDGGLFKPVFAAAVREMPIDGGSLKIPKQQAQEADDIPFSLESRGPKESGLGLNAEQYAVVKNIANRQKKKGFSSDEAVRQLSEQGINIPLAQYKAWYSERQQGIAKVGKQAATTERLRKQREGIAREDSMRASRFPGMTDEQIEAYLDDAMRVAHDELIALGAVNTNDSPISESRYYQMPDGQRYRLSTHSLPATEARDIASQYRDKPTDILINRYRPLNQIAEFVRDSVGFGERASLAAPLLAPNGKPSKLTPEQYRQVRTPEFKRWFGDWENDPANASKVVDENGEPLVVYHGTIKAFASFDPSANPRNRSGNPAGFYFTPDVDEASDYTMDWRKDPPEAIDGGNLMPLFLNVRKPFNYSGSSLFAKTPVNKVMVDKFEDELAKANTNVGKDWIKDKVKSFEVKGKTAGDPFPGISFPAQSKTAVLQAGGYDGMRDGKHWAAFSPTQIKSAIGNTGTFDPENPDIRYSLANGQGERPSEPMFSPATAPRVQAARRLKTLVDELRSGKIDQETFNRRVERLQQETQTVVESKREKREGAERQRGYDMVREKLIRARRLGELTEAEVDLALWAVEQNPAIALNLAVSIKRAKDGSSVQGSYNPLSQIVTLFKSSEKRLTALHEILHHTERMMPQPVRDAIAGAWAASVAREVARSSPERGKAILDLAGATTAQGLQKVFDDGMSSGVLSEADYQYANPSEFWAVNAAEIAQGRYLSKTAWQRLRRWFSEFVDKIKATFGGDAKNAAIIRGLDAVLSSGNTGEFVSPKMLGDEFGPEALAEQFGERAALGKSRLKPTLDPEKGQELTEAIEESSRPTSFARAVQDRLMDKLQSIPELQQRLMTPLGVAKGTAARRAWDIGQDMINAASLFISKAANVAPTLLPGPTVVDTWRDVFEGLTPKEADVLGRVVSRSTNVDERLYTDNDINIILMQENVDPTSPEAEKIRRSYFEAMDAVRVSNAGLFKSTMARALYNAGAEVHRATGISFAKGGEKVQEMVSDPAMSVRDMATKINNSVTKNIIDPVSTPMIKALDDAYAAIEKTRDMGGNAAYELERLMQNDPDLTRNVVEYYSDDKSIKELQRRLKRDKRIAGRNFEDNSPEVKAVDDAISALDNAVKVLSSAKPRNLLVKAVALRDTNREAAKDYQRLAVKGYFPDMRFGEYYFDVEVTDPETGKSTRLNFNIFESKSERDRAMKFMEEKLKTEYPDGNYKVESGTVEKEGYKRFQGISPESLALFAKYLTTGDSDSKGSQQDAQLREMLIRYGVSDRSAAKRTLERLKIPGQSMDTRRALASFITSNARLISRNLYSTQMLDAIDEIPREQGGLRDYMTRVYEYMNTWQDEGQQIRSFIAHWTILGSLTSGLLNLTGIFFAKRYLAPFTDSATLARSMGRAIKATATGSSTGQMITGNSVESAIRGTVTDVPDLDKQKDLAWDMYQLASESGYLDPQEVYNIKGFAEGESTLRPTIWREGKVARLAQGVGKVIDRASTRTFAMPEAINRQVAYLSGYQVGLSVGTKQGLTGEQLAEFAFMMGVETVLESNGAYNRGNRPEMFRGKWPAIVGTFKQYPIQVVEMLARMGRIDTDNPKELDPKVTWEQVFKNNAKWPTLKKKLGQLANRPLGVTLAMILLAAGYEELPFFGNAADLVDAMLQYFGYEGDTKKFMREVGDTVLGETIAEIARRGVFDAMGVSVSERIGFGRLIPGTDELKPSSGTARERVARGMMELAGPLGGIMGNMASGIDSIGRGQVKEGVGMMLPAGGKGPYQAAIMGMDGVLRDSRGKVVAEVGMGDAAIRAIGLQPSVVAQARRQVTEEAQTLGRVRFERDRLFNAIDAAYDAKDPEAERKAIERLQQWNIDYPELYIDVDPTTLRTRLSERNQPLLERFEKLKTKGMREGFVAKPTPVDALLAQYDIVRDTSTEEQALRRSLKTLSDKESLGQPLNARERGRLKVLRRAAQRIAKIRGLQTEGRLNAKRANELTQNIAKQVAPILQ